MKVNIVFPVLDEERRLEKGIRTTEAFLAKRRDIDAVITIVDNGSTDRTPDIIKELADVYSNIEYITLGERGFGLAFREAAKRKPPQLRCCRDHGFQWCQAERLQHADGTG